MTKLGELRTHRSPCWTWNAKAFKLEAKVIIFIILLLGNKYMGTLNLNEASSPVCDLKRAKITRAEFLFLPKPHYTLHR